MRILITGSEGVLGSVLKKELRDRGHDVYGCDLTHSADPYVIRADIAERRQLARIFDLSRPSIVFHFAAEFGRKNGQDYYEQLWATNCIGTRNVIEECLRADAKMVFASSSEVYGLSEEYTNGKHIALEERLLDKYVPKFHNEYSLSKWANERQIHTAARNQNLDAIILRFFNVYGPPERYSPYRSVVCQFAYKMLNKLPIDVNLEGFRSHLWIGDWCNTVANVVDEADNLSFNKYWEGSAGVPYLPTFNIGGDHYTPIKQLYDSLFQIIQPSYVDVSFSEREQANTATKRPDCHLAKEWLGHREEMPFEEGLRLTVEWLRSQVYRCAA